ncbi:hypothetical protein SDC9_58163 [bioreactor metagenome]|uniref:Uncharacterized protein n=1 Tax=bioreactor metagenome TaxID=1076179 RepID=A0A644X6N0_9ZZZZ
MSAMIKSLKITRRQQYIESYDSPEIKELAFLTEERRFDEQGRLIYSAKWDKPDVLEEKIIKTYNNNQITTEYYIDENELSEKTLTETDDNGNILRETMYYADGTESVSDFEYVNGKPVKKLTMDVDEYERELSGEYTWTYDSNGNLIREEESEYGEIVHYRDLKYDDHNRVVMQTIFHIVDGKPSQEEMEWDGENVIRLIKTDIYGEKTESLYTYNDQGEASKIKYSSKTYNSETIVEFDENNNAVHERETDEKGEVLYEVFREFDNETKVVRRIETYINRQGYATDVHYVLEYDYEFFR